MDLCPTILDVLSPPTWWWYEISFNLLTQVKKERENKAVSSNLTVKLI